MNETTQLTTLKTPTGEVLSKLNPKLSLLYTKGYIAFITLLIGIIVARLVRKIITRILKEFEVDKVMNRNISNQVGMTVEYIIYFITIIVIINEFGINKIYLNLTSMVVIVIAAILSTVLFRKYIKRYIKAKNKNGENKASKKPNKNGNKKKQKTK